MYSYGIRKIEKNKKVLSVCMSALLVLSYLGFNKISKNNTFVNDFPPVIMAPKCQIKLTRKRIIL